MNGSAPAGICPRCGDPVVAAQGGLLLDPDPHPLGVLRADGSKLTVRDVLAAHRAGTPAGHRRHACPPGGQAELFPISDKADKARSRRP